jgi:hypothetical protein
MHDGTVKFLTHLSCPAGHACPSLGTGEVLTLGQMRFSRTSRKFMRGQFSTSPVKKKRKRKGNSVSTKRDVFYGRF